MGKERLFRPIRWGGVRRRGTPRAGESPRGRIVPLRTELPRARSARVSRSAG